MCDCSSKARLNGSGEAISYPDSRSNAVQNGNVATVSSGAEGGAVAALQPFQVEFIRNMIEDSLDELRWELSFYIYFSPCTPNELSYTPALWGAGVAHLVSVRSSELEVPVLGDSNIIFNFLLIRVALAISTRNRALTEEGGWGVGLSLHRGPQVYQLLNYCHVLPSLKKYALPLTFTHYDKYNLVLRLFRLPREIPWLPLVTSHPHSEC